MKKLILPALLGCCCTAQAQNIIDNYLSGTPTYTVIANASNSVNQPRDLDFKPFTNELWIVNRGTSAGGTNVLMFNAGESNQTTQYRMDSHAGHFFVYPSAMAFGDYGEWGSTNEIKNSTPDPSVTFMGPALWTGDTSIFARVFQNNWEGSKPLGSHLDMLHQSPFAMGIAHDSASMYWVFDGHNGNLCKYDFTQDHSPGYDDHSDGRVWRYTDVPLVRVANVPGHMVEDKATGWLYIVDAGTKKLKRVNTNTGAVSGTLSVPGTGAEALAGYWAVTGATVEEIETFTTQPCGVDVYNGRLIVGDYNNGDISVYDITGANPVKLGVIATGQAGMMGVKIGFDGRIWFVNYTQNTVMRIEPSALLNDDAGVIAINAPVVNNGEPDFYHPGFNVCAGNITPAVTIKNTGANTITSLNISYSVDGGAVTTYAWNGSLASGMTTQVTLPSSAVPNGNHKLAVDVSGVNGNIDNNPANNIINGSFRSINPVAGFPFTEGFSSSVFPPVGWTYLAHNPHNEMTHNASVGASAPGAVKMDNYAGNTDIEGQRDYLITPRIDLTNATANVNVSFALAYARVDGSYFDRLRVNASTDCGDTWTNIYDKSGTTLATAPDIANPFTPNATQWRTESVSLGAYMGQPEVMLQFVAVSGWGNNLYLDDISVSNTLGVDGVTAPALKLYPNPATSMVTIDGLLDINEDATVSIYDMTGRLVQSAQYAKGTAKAQLDIAALSSGNYIVKITAAHFSSQEKLTVVK